VSPGDEFIKPILIFVFGANIRAAGTPSVLISTPTVLTGVARRWLTGHYRSQGAADLHRLICGAQ